MRATNGHMTGQTRHHAGWSHYWQPGGPITGKPLVPCLWQNHPSGGPMLVAADIGLTQVEFHARCDGAEPGLLEHRVGGVKADHWLSGRLRDWDRDASVADR